MKIMTTIVNNPQPETSGNSGIMSLIIGIIVIIVFAYIFMMFGLPAIRQMQGGTPQINIPSEVDVNINQPK